MAVEAVRQGDSGPRVASLHKGLLYLIRNQGGMVNQSRTALESPLEHDLATNSFGTRDRGYR